MDANKESIKLHRKLRGKISVESKIKIRSQKMLGLLYTPGVAAVSQMIANRKDLVYDYTSKWNSVAIVTDGSRVLGLGNIGPEAALPVMEGKTVLFKLFGGVDAFPVCLGTQKTDEIVSAIKAIAPSFGGINLEDIDSPRCFEVGEILEKEIDIPVFHDDQHGTAIVTLAAMKNALKVVKKDAEDARVVIAGAGAAGIGIARLFANSRLKDVILLDSKGIIYRGRRNMNRYKKMIAEKTNKGRKKGSLDAAIAGADVLIGVSGVANSIDPKIIRDMADNPIVFALTNPVPEIDPKKAEKFAAVIGTGRSDYKNQINNSLVFPGIFRGALDVRAKKINYEMKIAASKALAAMINKPTKNNIVPKTTNRNVVRVVADAVRKAARKSGVARL